MAASDRENPSFLSQRQQNLRAPTLKNLNKFFLLAMVSIAGLDKVQVLHALWSNQMTTFFGGVCGPIFDAASAQTAVQAPYIGYFQGCIKTDLRGDFMQPDAYDREAGPGKMAQMIAQLRASPVVAIAAPVHYKTN